MAKFTYDDFKKQIRANLQPKPPTTQIQNNKFNALLQRAKAKVK